MTHSVSRVALSFIASILLATPPAAQAADPEGPSWVIAVRGTDVVNEGDTTLLRGGMIRTENLFSDFVLKFQFRLMKASARGQIYVRSWFGYGGNPRSKIGYRVALANKTGGTGASGHVTALGVKMDGTFEAPMDAPVPGAWQTCEIRADRETLSVMVNGTAASRLHALDEFAGYIAIESGGAGDLEIKGVQLTRLPWAKPEFGENAIHVKQPGVAPPRRIKEVKPYFPSQPYVADIRGEVLLEVVIDANGAVGDIRVVKSVHPDFDEAAVGAVRKWRFTPATQQGKPIDVIVTVAISFARR